MITFLKKVFKKGELRQRIFYTLGMLFVFRIGCAITVPGVNTAVLSKTLDANSLLGIMNLLGGGTLERFSIFALGVSPYITASIIIELLSMDVIPYLTDLTKEGQKGRKKKDQITRFLTLALAALQGGSMTYAFDKSYGILTSSTFANYAYIVTIMIAGSMFALWMGDQITNKGIGNGTSLIIFTGIVASLPASFITAFESMVKLDGSTKGWLSLGSYLLLVVVYLLIIVFVVFTEGAERRIDIVYSNNISSTSPFKNTQFMPIKINSSGVIPVIFASSVLAAPRTIISFMKTTDLTTKINDILNFQKPIGFALYIIMIIAFSFFYADLQVDPDGKAKDMQKNGSNIRGVNPGNSTAYNLRLILYRITAVGSLCLVVIAAIPVLAPIIWSQTANTGLTLGGTGLIIVTGVALETVKQIKTEVQHKEYRGSIRR